MGVVLPIVVMCWTTVLAQASEPSPTATAITRVVDAPTSPSAGLPAWASTADALLAALEVSDQGLRTFQAQVRYDQVFELQGDRQVRDGVLAFDTGAGEDGASRRFAVRFDRFRVGDVVHEQDLSLVFDGRWLVERSDAKKQLITREVVREGERIDPLRLGEGPFPLPLGQKREDILARYEATVLPATAELVAHEPDEQAALERFVEGCVQLKLVPKPEQAQSTAMRFREIRLWYRPWEGTSDTAAGVKLLPRLARTISTEGNVGFVQLVRPKVNESLPAAMMDTAPPADTAGWDVRTERLPAR